MKSSGSASSPTYLAGLFDTLTRRGRALLSLASHRASHTPKDLSALGEELLSRRGEASGVAVAQELLESFQSASPEARAEFMQALAEKFGPDPRLVAEAVAQFSKDPHRANAEKLHAASEPRRQELLRRLNLAPGGTSALVEMRADLLEHLKTTPALGAVDADFAHLFSSWFNRGFLVLRLVDWTTPANILEKIIRYEAVHEINGWDDLRNRLEPADRRCFAFFHPQLVDEPLIFVEVALTRDIPAQIAPLLDMSRTPIADSEADTAVFYSISNTQHGLAGVSFGNFLIKQVVRDLARVLPKLRTFVTLSPVPSFADWLAREIKAEHSLCLDDDAKQRLAVLSDTNWHLSPASVESVRKPLLAAAAYYFLKAKTKTGRPIDPVARFHLNNGARLERLNFMGDLSPKGLKQSHGLMVNYLYAPDDIEANHEVFAESGGVIASAAVKKMLRANLPSSDLVATL